MSYLTKVFNSQPLHFPLDQYSSGSVLVAHRCMLDFLPTLSLPPDWWMEGGGRGAGWLKERKTNEPAIYTACVRLELINNPPHPHHNPSPTLACCFHVVKVGQAGPHHLEQPCPPPLSQGVESEGREVRPRRCVGAGARCWGLVSEWG